MGYTGLLGLLVLQIYELALRPGLCVWSAASIARRLELGASKKRLDLRLVWQLQFQLAEVVLLV